MPLAAQDKFFSSSFLFLKALCRDMQLPYLDLDGGAMKVWGSHFRIGLENPLWPHIQSIASLLTIVKWPTKAIILIPIGSCGFLWGESP